MSPTPTNAVFGTGPFTHFTASNWVLESTASNALQLRMTANGFLNFGFLAPSACTGNGVGGNATMSNPHRFATTSGSTLTATFCAEGSVIDVTVATGSEIIMLRCIKISGNHNRCVRAF